MGSDATTSRLEFVRGLIDVATKGKVAKLATDGIEIEMSPLAFIPAEAEPELRHPQRGATETVNGNPVDRDTLYWSSGGPPDVEDAAEAMAEREAEKQESRSPKKRAVR